MVKKPSTHDMQFIAGDLALDFVNTVGNRLGESRDYLTNAQEFNHWAHLAQVLDKRDSLRVSPRQLTTARGVREELYSLFHPLALGKKLSNTSLSLLNKRFSRLAHKRQLNLNRGQVGWTWDTRRDDLDRILAPILLSAANLLISGGAQKIRQCQGEFCGWLFLDRSQAGRRRWCSMADCGNREKVRRHYRRVRKKLVKSSNV